MKYKKIKKSPIYLLVLVIVLSFTRCANTEKGAKKDFNNAETTAENETNNVEEKTEDVLAKDRLNLDYKIEHAKVLVDLEQAKIHFIVETNKFKAQANLDKAKNRLEALEKSGNTKYLESIQKTKATITDLKQLIKNDDSAAKDKLNELSNSISLEINRIDDNIKAKETKISEDYKRHNAELKAKEYILKAIVATNRENMYAKSIEYLDKADQEYVVAKQYGNEKYKTTIEDLRTTIEEAKISLKANEKKANEKINAIITKLNEYTYQEDQYYPYILIP